MKLIEIAPFVRFAYRILLRNISFAAAQDNRLFYVISGKGAIRVDNTEYHFSPGTVMLWQRGCEYHINTAKDVEVISINFDYDCSRCDHVMPYDRIPAADIKKAGITPIIFEDCPILNSPCICNANSQITGILNKIIYEHTSGRAYKNERISALLKECIVSIVRTVSVSSDSKTNNVLTLVLDYIHTNYATDIDNNTLATVAGYHPYHLNKLFVAANGVSLHKYVINYRLSVAEHLLLSSSNTIESIAVSVGFSSALSFSASFKKKNGLSPTEFRQRFGSSL